MLVSFLNVFVMFISNFSLLWLLRGGVKGICDCGFGIWVIIVGFWVFFDSVSI